ncbi:MAG: crossover junction endodeoxyribonuclease RuvC [Eggerthellaceae bacterium]|nr:crossover junction endodeoxyribonuclease RuvC [Eggerthellaceae bacterium]
MQQQGIILGIDPGLAHTGWGIIEHAGSKLACLAYGCVETGSADTLPVRLKKIHDQIAAVVGRYKPSALGIESVWFGENTSSAFATGQARGAALVACAGLEVTEFTPRQIKLAVVGTGTAEKEQVAYMVQQLLGLDAPPTPDHAADALAAAICFTSQNALVAQLNSHTAMPEGKT